MTNKRVHSYAKHFHEEHMVEIAGPNEAYRTLMRHNGDLMDEIAQLLRALKFQTVYEMRLRQQSSYPEDAGAVARLTALFRLLSQLEEKSDDINVGRAIEEHFENEFDAKERREVYDLMESLHQC